MSGCRCGRGGRPGRRWSLQDTLDPSGAGLKQIDPARPLPVHRVTVKVRPGFQQARHEPFGNGSADLDGADGLNDHGQTAFWDHASRSMWNVALPSTIPSARAPGALSGTHATIKTSGHRLSNSESMIRFMM